MKKLFSTLLAVLALAGLALPVSADSSITVTDQGVQLVFPKTITFSMDASSAAEIQKITLVVRFADVTQRIPAKFTPATRVTAQVEWNLDTETSVRAGGYLPPGVVAQYNWIIEDAAGNKLETEPQALTITDNRIEWQTRENDELAIHWYGRDTKLGDNAFEGGINTLAQLKEVLGGTPSGKVHVWLYTDADDFRTSMPDMNTWTGGRSFGEYRVIILYVAPGESQATTVGGVQHELTHQVIHDSLGSGLARSAFPHWLNEGLATYYQYNGAGMDGYLANALEDAIRTDTVPRLKSRDAAFPADSEEAYVSYALSYSIVKMLLRNFGEEKMREMFKLFEQGIDADEVFTQVYGADTDGLDNLWRESVGLPPRETSSQGIPTAAARPTFSLSSAETPVKQGAATATPQAVSLANTPAPAVSTPATQSGNGSSSGAGTTGLCGGVLGGIALAMFGAYEWRKRRHPVKL